MNPKSFLHFNWWEWWNNFKFTTSKFYQKQHYLSSLMTKVSTIGKNLNK